MFSHEPIEPVEEPPAVVMPAGALLTTANAEDELLFHSTGTYCSYVPDHDLMSQV